MKQEILLSLVLGLGIPMGLLGLAAAPQAAEAKETEPPPLLETAPAKAEEPVTVLVRNLGEMELEVYLAGVVLGEMPADFEPEALKAQAVVARTYTLKRAEGSKHPDGAVCTDPGCCQAYRSTAEYLSSGGSREEVEKVTAAVSATAGQVLTYEGDLIDATYFSCSGGQTESAVEVWGSDVPYLQAVESPGEEDAAYYSQTVEFSPEEFSRLVGFENSGDPAGWFGPVTRTEGDGVDTMELRGKVYSGTELRKALGLRSTAFTVEVRGDRITVSVLGFGHRVGMSQYGAQAMAREGSTYDEILEHYYQGTRLEIWSP